ncbi:hypothetical protein CRG98_004948 [Punica granatum]|uniref:Uncharacterized protein n=1 Tax=Punica granatum TaxID=22663 RepID=A0A2I0L1P6_PUNGR|nr:hypothetical protein CRG98_004948 [Punica granatum]
MSSGSLLPPSGWAKLKSFWMAQLRTLQEKAGAGPAGGVLRNDLGWEELNSCLINFRTQHAFREANTAADFMARTAREDLHSQDAIVHCDAPPFEVLNFIL